MTDDLDLAQEVLDSDVATDDEGVSYSLRAIAHTLLWTAKQQRAAQEMLAEHTRMAKEWRAAQPQPPPPLPAVQYPVTYQGF